MRFRKKPFVIEAVQFTGGNSAEIREFTGVSILVGNSEAVFIQTPEGEMRAIVGDWIIRGVKGEYYPCKPDIFEMTYDRVDEPVP